MYVIKDKKGRFWNGSAKNPWTKSIRRAEKFDTKREACYRLAPGERVFEVKLVLGKQAR